jgi:hypothetical protein
MATTIQDGTGTKLKLKINAENRAEVQAIILDQEDDAISKGEGYQIASGQVTFTSNSASVILYVKNNANEDFILDRAVLVLGSSSGSLDYEDWTFQVLRNPQASGSIISNSVSAGISNSNHGSANTPDADCYRGVEGDTIFGGTGAPLPIQKTQNRTIFPLGRRLPKGSSIAFKLTPPTSNLSAKAVLVTHFYYGFNI